MGCLALPLPPSYLHTFLPSCFLRNYPAIFSICAVSILIPGPIVVETAALLRYLPLLDDGFAFRMDSSTALALSMSLFSSNDALPKSEGQAVLGRQDASPTPWLTERHGYDPTSRPHGGGDGRAPQIFAFARRRLCLQNGLKHRLGIVDEFVFIE